MSQQYCTVAREGALTIITLNRPEVMNALHSPAHFELAAAFDDFFGSFDKFVAQFTAAANGLQGSGWAVLAFDAASGKLVTYQLFDQQGNVPVGVLPLLQLDMWEHAFYLDYVNVKADYVKAFWNIANWADAGARFEAARSGAAGLLLLS